MRVEKLQNFFPISKYCRNFNALQIAILIPAVESFYPFGCHEWTVPISAFLRQDPRFKVAAVTSH